MTYILYALRTACIRLPNVAHRLHSPAARNGKNWIPRRLSVAHRLHSPAARNTVIVLPPFAMVAHRLHSPAARNWLRLALMDL